MATTFIWMFIAVSIAAGAGIGFFFQRKINASHQQAKTPTPFSS